MAQLSVYREYLDPLFHILLKYTFNWRDDAIYFMDVSFICFLLGYSFLFFLFLFVCLGFCLLFFMGEGEARVIINNVCIGTNEENFFFVFFWLHPEEKSLK